MPPYSAASLAQCLSWWCQPFIVCCLVCFRYQTELPKKIKSRGKEAHLLHDELVQTIKWKLAVGPLALFLLRKQLKQELDTY